MKHQGYCRARDLPPGLLIFLYRKSLFCRRVTTILANTNIYYRAPFHCSLMQEAAIAMEEALKKVEIKKPIVDIVSNVTAKPVSGLHRFSVILSTTIYLLTLLSPFITVQ